MGPNVTPVLKNQLHKADELLRTGIALARRLGNTPQAQDGFTNAASGVAGSQAEKKTTRALRKTASLDMDYLREYAEAKYAN